MSIAPEIEELGFRPSDDQRLHIPSLLKHLESYSIVSVGNRSVDHAVRDLLYGSLQRDPRCYLYRAILKSTAPWTFVTTRGLTPMQTADARKFWTFYFLHLLSLNLLRGLADETSRNYIERLSHCWPVGARVDWGGARPKADRDVCGLARACPFCLGRRVLDLYQRLTAFLQRDSRKLLVLLKVDIADHEFPENWSRDRSDRCELVRQQLAKRLVDFARSHGVQGGITVFQAGPRISGSSGR